MKVVITGGCGFLGQQLGQRLLQRALLTGPSGKQEEIDELVLVDTASRPSPSWYDERVRVAIGDISEVSTILDICDRADLSVFHTASILSGGGEADFDLAMRVNLDGTRHLLEALRALDSLPRIVFTSTIAVFGGAFTAAPVGDSTKQSPQTTYGTTKAMAELLVNDYTRKGFLDGRVCRLPTVIVRPGTPNAAASSFTSSVVREPFHGVDVVVPVPLTTEMAVIGHRTAVSCLIAMHELDPAKLGADRAVELPSTSVTVEELVQTLHRAAGQRTLGKVTYEPDPGVIRIVDSWATRTDFDRARVLGLPQDVDVETIVRAYIEDFGGYVE